ncbi:MAG: alpha/beta hydrolase [Bacteroidota bacterium]|nr:alpha/beta hydrolase [Bacteroidota bacterium]
MMKSLLCLLVVIPNFVDAQVAVPRDTSFTVYSSYVKESKKRPYITVAEAALPPGVRQKKQLVFALVNGRKLYADIFYPVATSKKGYPGIVMIFGGGWKSGDRSQNVPIAQQLAAKGYVAMTIDYRLSPEATYPAAVYDVKAAIRWLRANGKEFGLNPKKIATLGMSAGGQLAALAGATNGRKELEGDEGNTKQQADVQAIIDIDGILAFHHPESAEGAVAAEWLGGTYAEKPAIWQAASALTYAGNTSPPMLFINSSTPRFHAGRDDMIKKLDSVGVYTEVHTLPDTPHPFWFFHPWFKATVQYCIDFLDKVFAK